MTLGRFIAKPDNVEIELEGSETEEDATMAQKEPSDSDFELLDKSTDSLDKAKSSGLEKSGKSSKRKNKKR